MEDIPALKIYSWFYDSSVTREVIENKLLNASQENSNYYAVRVKDGDSHAVRCALSIKPGLASAKHYTIYWHRSVGSWKGSFYFKLSPVEKIIGNCAEFQFKLANGLINLQMDSDFKKALRCLPLPTDIPETKIPQNLTTNYSPKYQKTQNSYERHDAFQQNYKTIEKNVYTNDSFFQKSPSFPLPPTTSIPISRCTSYGTDSVVSVVSKKSKTGPVRCELPPRGYLTMQKYNRFSSKKQEYYFKICKISSTIEQYDADPKLATMRPMKQIYLDEILSISRCAPTKFKIKLSRRSSRTFIVRDSSTRDRWMDYIEDRICRLKLF